MGDDLSSKFNKILLGQLGGSTIPLTSLEPTAQRLSPDNPKSEAAKEKNRRDFERMIDAANEYIEQLRKEIDEMERGFDEDDEAWREKLALKILDADDIPQRRAGESMDDYRERLEPSLIEKMLNPDGSKKSQYANDPELNIYAEWAQKKYHYNAANGHVQKLNDPNAPPEEKEKASEELENNANIEMINYVDRGLTNGSDAQGQVKNVADQSHDVNLQANHGAALDDFLNLKS